MAGKIKSKGGMAGGKKTKGGMAGGKKTKMGMAGGRQAKMVESGVESNKEFVKRTFGVGGNTRMTNDEPMENKGFVGGRFIRRKVLGKAGGKKTKMSYRGGRKTKGGTKGGKKGGKKS
tara:strand:- start:174 stop:527 length:354 start_codon:yes stop_codon:yes gene_type:complete